MIGRRLLSLSLAGALASTLPVATRAGAQSAGSSVDHDLLDRAVAAWARVKTARATFEQTIENPLTGGTLTATGEYQQQRPGKLSVHFDNPATDRIVADGRYVWLYLPSSAPGQVIRTAQSSLGAGTLDVSAQFLTSPRSRYVVTAAGALTVSGRATHGYTLVPRTAGSAPFQSALVYIDDANATIRQFEVTESNGVKRKVRLTSFRTNVPVDAKAFVFTPPAGVRIVQR